MSLNARDKKNKIYGIILLILFVNSFSFALSLVTDIFQINNTGKINSVNIPANSGYWKDIQDAIDIAQVGDTVIIPEGTFNFVNIGESWSGARVVIPAGINLCGVFAQRDADNQVVDWKTILVMPWDVPGDWYGKPIWFKVVGNSDPNKSTRINDIKIVGYRSLEPTSITLHIGIEIENVINFRIDHVCLEHTSGGGIETWGYKCSGVIDHCKVYNIHGYDVLESYTSGNIGYGISVGRGYYSTGYGYEPTMEVLGKYTDHSIYIENCYLSKWRHCVSSGHGVHFVFRYNVIADDFGHFSLDSHGLRDNNANGDRWGTRATEFYENTLINVTDFRTILQNGGGSGVWFNNYVDTTYVSGGIVLYVEDYVPDNTWHLKDFYLWSNTGTWVPSWNGIPPGFTADRNVLADWSRPAYNVSDPLYPNVDSSWSIAGYIPYTYPHPLVLTGG